MGITPDMDGVRTEKYSTISKYDWIYLNLFIIFDCIMRTIVFCLLLFLSIGRVTAGIVEKTYVFDGYSILNKGDYRELAFDNTVQSARIGEPCLPYHKVVLMLPPGESALSIEVIGEEETTIPGTYMLFPQQPPQPTKQAPSGQIIRTDAAYSLDGSYPSNPSGQLQTQYLNGYSIALCTFTPVKYNPARGMISFYRKVTVRITSGFNKNASEALSGLSPSQKITSLVERFVQNPVMMSLYPSPKAPMLDYDYLMICSSAFLPGLQPLVNHYTQKGISCQVKTIEWITDSVSGADLPEKIRNCIRNEYLTYNIEYVLLAGNQTLLPARGFHAYVQSGSGYSDDNIPADLYYSGMDGNYNADGDNLFGEVSDMADLLPELSVARFPVANSVELVNMVNKSICYQVNPVPGELNKILLAGEYLWASPLTFGGPFMDLLIGDHTDYGYFTHGIPQATHAIEKLYDSITPSSTTWQWTAALLLNRLNSGPSFIHHLGHASVAYMMRLNTSDITNANFSQVDGITHNYQILYTQGCYDGALDYANCISVKSVTIENFLVAGVFNSRYGWFNEGTSNGPSEHLEREFTSALYHDTLPERHIGTAQKISKINTAPWIGLPGEWEPGAQRWVHYCCNVFGDSAMEIWTEEPSSFGSLTWTGSVNTDWNNAGNWNPQRVPTTLDNVLIPDVPNKPMITTINTTFCHDVTIQQGARLVVESGKSITIHGNLTIEE
jgi:hypothetical protein